MKTLLHRLVPMLFALTLQAAPPASPQEEAEKLLQAGKAAEAVEMMRQEAQKDEKDPYRLYNLGLTLYRAGRYDEAINAFQSIDTADNRDLQTKSALQLGNIQFRLAQKLQKANQMDGAILSMERALGYYESANEIQAGTESKTNQKATVTRLETTLLNVAEGADKHAAAYSISNNLHFEEVMLRNALQARQRAGELDPCNSQIPPLIANTTARLVAGLARQGDQLAKEADATTDAKIIKPRRKLAISKYEDALALDPQNTKIAAARDEQLKKLSDLLTDEAEAQASPALAKPDGTLDEKDQSNLEQAKTKLEDALSLLSTNTRADDLYKRVLKKLEDYYVDEGEKDLKTSETMPAPHDKLDLVKKAAEQFQKALNINPKNEPAQKGLKNAEDQLPDLHAAAGQDDLAQAKAKIPGHPPSPKGMSNAALQDAKDLLEKSVDNLSTALALKPGVAPWQKSLEEAQKLLDAVNDEINNLLAGNPPPPPPPGGSDEVGGGEATMLPLSFTNGASQRPFLGDKFWNRKIRDW